jgi:hypothetical protein
MPDLNPNRFTLCQADAAREDYAQLMEELELVKWQLARLPHAQGSGVCPLKIMFGSAVAGAALVILWFEAFWRIASERASHQPCLERN